MLFKKILLSEYYPNVDSKSYLNAYIPDNSEEVDLKKKRRTMLVFPGGGYWFCSYREAEPVALKLLAKDFNVFVLFYPVQPLTFPHPQIEAIAALHFIQDNADEFNVDINKIYGIGFSAGGHLLASTSVHYNDPVMLKKLNIENIRNFNGNIFAYSVLDLRIGTCGGTAKNLCKDDKNLFDYYNPFPLINKDFPQSYLCAGKNDDTVPIEHTIKTANKLNELGIRNKCELFEWGEHGFSVCDASVYPDKERIDKLMPIKNWIYDAIDFLENK